MSRISVVIATKDRAAFVERALDAFAGQRDAPPFEVIVADNGSTDATPAVVEAARRRVPFALQRIDAGNANRALARNAGIAAASGELIAFVDDDVWLPAGFLAAHARAHESAAFRAVSGPIVNVASYEERPRPGPQNFSNAFFVTCNVSIPKRALEAVGGFDESFDLYGWEDTELGLRLRESGVERFFAWDAYLYHIKPPAIETLDVSIRKTLEKAQMAARFVRKKPTLRTKLATGAYGLNLLRAKLTAPLLPLYAGLASSSRVPKALGTYARARLLDGLYTQRLARELDADPSRPA
ncbi:MAG: glycosyltransferase [Candidatus Eremiobacteraeota bacterium]|nr:glycosyltransferase [Candidatus Eremiobacteraeota bacterium]